MLFLPIAGAALAPLLVRALRHHAAWPLSLALLVPFLVFLGHAGTVAAGGAVSGGFAWIPTLGIDYAWRLDGLSLTFALLITGIGTLIVLYSGAYLKGHPGQGRFLAFILMFSASMLGLVVSDSLLMLFVYWELTSITSFLLIGFDSARPAARRGALQALLVTGGGGLALLAGLLLVGQITGTAEVGAAVASTARMAEHPLAVPALVLLMAGAFTKSAQFPFHVWLPNAMEAPTPVSAFLHSATMVKAGVYLLMRFYPLFGGFALWQTVLPLVGGVTLLAGAWLALGQSDLKRILAYTTMASLGLLVLLTGIGGETAIAAAVLYLLAHALFKGALFMIAGVIDHEAGTRDITRLGGLARAMPLTFAAALLAAASMGGLPLFSGFMAKEEIYAALPVGSPAFLAAFLGNAMMFAAGFAIALKVFLGTKTETPRHGHDGPPGLMAGPVILALLGLALALVPGVMHGYLSGPMASAVLGQPAAVTITAVPHLSLPFLLSLLTIALGVAFLVFLRPVRATVVGLVDRIGWGPDRGFDQLVAVTVNFSWRLARLMQPGRLELYLTTVFIVIAASLLGPLLLAGDLPAWPRWAPLAIQEVAFILIAVLGLVAVLSARSRLTAIVALGIQGFAVAVLYLLYGAPDLSFTQFMVETLSVVILALIMTRLKLDVTDRRPPRERIIDGAIALACGLGFALLLFRVLDVPFDPALSRLFAEHAKTVAHGANVVNVIIVDFRGVDTLGEIAVVTITGLAILALIRLRAAPAARTFNDPDAEERAP
jgi:multicomponent Na+:H+ antiporter subunit A